MGPISEIDMTYSMDCYLRQSWVDERLAFQGRNNTGEIEELALGIDLLRKIWKPDTYFYNGMKYVSVCGSQLLIQLYHQIKTSI